LTGASSPSLRGMRLTVELPLRASRAEVWAAVSTVGGINREVAPFLRMTDPTHGARFDTEPWQVGAPVLWQLGLGFIPVDRHRVEVVALPDTRGFREASSSWWHRVWWHERTLLDDPDGCIVRDDVQIEPRLGAADPIVGWAVRRMFQRRHQRLRRQFGDKRTLHASG
jgi:ligand-binding SRPBCC domain-containing protein